MENIDKKKEAVALAISNHRVMAVGEEHFFAKKDYPNGLPEEFEKK